MIKFLLFDFANTLVYKPDVFKVFQNFIKNTYTKDLSLEDIKTQHDIERESRVFPDKTTQEFYLDFNASVLKRLGIDEPQQKDLLSLYQDLKELKWQAFDDSEILNKIDLPKAILSNWDECLGKFVEELMPYDFEFVMGSYLTGFSKPDTRFFQAALDKIVKKRSLSADNILMIGDSPNLDIEPALKLGMQAALIDRGGQFDNEKGIIIDSLGKLPELLKEINETK